MEYKLIIRTAEGEEVFGSISDNQSAVFGRGRDATYTIPDALVSRAHCIIHVDAESRIFVEDLGSSNGTVMNGVPVREKTEYFPGGIIDIGNSSVELVSQGVLSTDSSTNIDFDTVGIQVEGEEELDTDSVNFAKKFDVDKGPVDDLDDLEIDPHDLALRLNSICNLASKLFGANQESEIINIAVDIVLDISKSERCSVILYHKSSSLLEPVASKYHNSEKAGETFKTSNTVVRYVIKTGESVITENAVDDDRFGVSQSLALGNISSVMCVPLATHDKILGVIYTDSSGAYGGDFDNSTLAVMAAAAHQVAVAIERVRLYIGLEKMFFGSMLALAASIEAKDKYTKGHSERVTCYSLMIADELKLSEDERTVVELAGLLHDVGKIGVPEAVLCSKFKLTDEEFELIKKHPDVGADIILKMPELGSMTSIREVARVVRAHHEKFDGTGYPKGLAGKRIPIGSRILAIADTFDALTSNRTYRAGMPVTRALEILRECSGTQVDPDVLDAFLMIYERGELVHPERVKAHVSFDHELLRDNTVING